MDSMEDIVTQTLAQSPLGRQLLVRRIPTDWPRIVGPHLAGICEVQDIQPPLLIVSVTNSVWMQELQMKRRQILDAIQAFYGEALVTDIRLRMKERSFVKRESKRTLEGWNRISSKRIPMDQIPITTEEETRLQQSVAAITDEKRRELLYTAQVQALKKKKWLARQGYYPCRSCGMLIHSGIALCRECLENYKRRRRTYLVARLKQQPLLTCEDVQADMRCTQLEFNDARRELIYFYMEKIRLEAATMQEKRRLYQLIRQHSDAALDDAAMEAFADHYRSRYVAKLKQIEAQDTEERKARDAHQRRT